MGLESVISAVLFINAMETGNWQELLPYRSSFQHYAMSLEILDKRHRTTWLAQDSDFNADMQEMHARYEHFKTAPPSHHAMMFPAKCWITQALNFNAEYQKYLIAVRPTTWDKKYIDIVIYETQQLEALYREMETAVDEEAIITQRRESLAKLRDIHLGVVGYYSGVTPCPVPIKHFRTIGR